MPPKLLDPPDIHAPLGAYSHTAAVPPGSELVFVSGQVGIGPDGRVPADLAGQVEIVFQNLRAAAERLRGKKAEEGADEGAPEKAAKPGRAKREKGGGRTDTRGKGAKASTPRKAGGS